MSGYIVDDGYDVYKVVIENSSTREIPNYKKERVTNKQHKRYKKTVKHIQDTWDDIESIGRFYIQYDIDTNELMKDIHKLFFLYSRKNKNVLLI
jgi:hypothetical protein